MRLPSLFAPYLVHPPIVPSRAVPSPGLSRCLTLPGPPALVHPSRAVPPPGRSRCLAPSGPLTPAIVHLSSCHPLAWSCCLAYLRLPCTHLVPSPHLVIPPPEATTVTMMRCDAMRATTTRRNATHARRRRRYDACSDVDGTTVPTPPTTRRDTTCTTRMLTTGRLTAPCTLHELVFHFY